MSSPYKLRPGHEQEPLLVDCDAKDMTEGEVIDHLLAALREIRQEHWILANASTPILSVEVA